MKMRASSILTMIIFLFLSGATKAQGLTKTKVTTSLSIKKTCRELVEDILSSSPRFKKLTKNLFSRVKKNGGSGYGTMMYASPDPTRDQAEKLSEKYEIGLHETYPDRNVNIAFFEFDPKSKLLYEVDMAGDGNPKSISFDRKLLSQFNKTCK